MSTDTIIHEMAFLLHIGHESARDSLHMCQWSTIYLLLWLCHSHVKHFWHYVWSEFSTCSLEPALPFRTVTFNSIFKSVSSHEFEKSPYFFMLLRLSLVPLREHKNSIQSGAKINDDLTCLVVAFPIKAISLKEKCIIFMLLVALGGCWVVAYWFKSKAFTKSLWYSGLNIWLGFLIQIYVLCNRSGSGHVIKSTTLTGWPVFFTVH